MVWDQLLGQLTVSKHRQRLHRYYLFTQEARKQPLRAISVFSVINAPLMHAPHDPICAIFIFAAYLAARDDVRQHSLDIDTLTENLLAPFRADPNLVASAKVISGREPTKRQFRPDREMREDALKLMDGELGLMLGDTAESFRSLLNRLPPEPAARVEAEA